MSLSDLEFGFAEKEQRDLDLGFERVLGELKQRAESAKPRRALLVVDNVDQPKFRKAVALLRGIADRGTR